MEEKTKQNTSAFFNVVWLILFLIAIHQPIFKKILCSLVLRISSWLIDSLLYTWMCSIELKCLPRHFLLCDESFFFKKASWVRIECTLIRSTSFTICEARQSVL